MHCKNCGHALSLNSAVCPFCGMLMSSEQMKRRKEINGYNNPYMQKLNKINKDSYKYKLDKNENTSNIGAMIFIVVVIIFVTVVALIIYLSER